VNNRAEPNPWTNEPPTSVTAGSGRGARLLTVRKKRWRLVAPNVTSFEASRAFAVHAGQIWVRSSRKARASPADIGLAGGEWAAVPRKNLCPIVLRNGERRSLSDHPLTSAILLFRQE